LSCFMTKFYPTQTRHGYSGSGHQTPCRVLSIGSTWQVLPFITASGGSCLGSQFATAGPSGGSLDVLFNSEPSRSAATVAAALVPHWRSL
jgi:hypothetical protein